MRQFSLLIKPAGSSCNIRCPYCFYRGHGPGVRMSDDVLKRTLNSYTALPIANPAVAFQGGEPLLMGEDFFRRAAALAPRVSFSVQTNATLVTPTMAKFFAEKDWLVGVSPHWDAGALDEGMGIKGYETLRAANVAVNIMQLVTKDNVKEPEKLYRHIRDDLGSNWHQYIECTSPEPFAITGEEWGEFLCRIFDVWRNDGDEHRVSVRLFDSIVSQLVNGYPTMCNFNSDCRNYFVVEANGDIFPCDFHVMPEYKLGNIMVDSWEKLLESPRYEAFGLRKRKYPDCPRNGGRLNTGWQRFFAYAVPYLRALVSRP